MVRKTAIALALMLFSTAAWSNDWEKFYTSIGLEGTIASEVAPQVLPMSSDVDSDVAGMFRRGFALIGYTAFETGNSKTDDAVKLGRKLSARYVLISTNLESSSVSTVPLTMPSTTTSYTNGTVSSGGFGARYTGTTTTYGTQTTYIPIRVNRFTKAALYFREMPKVGAGFQGRDVTDAEARDLNTRRAIGVQYVRDASPAYFADLLPGDLIVKVNGKPPDRETWRLEIAAHSDLVVEVRRGTDMRTLNLHIPDEWRTRSS